MRTRPMARPIDAATRFRSQLRTGALYAFAARLSTGNMRPRTCIHEFSPTLDLKRRDARGRFRALRCDPTKKLGRIRLTARHRRERSLDEVGSIGGDEDRDRVRVLVIHEGAHEMVDGSDRRASAPPRLPDCAHPGFSPRPFIYTLF